MSGDPANTYRIPSDTFRSQRECDPHHEPAPLPRLGVDARAVRPDDGAHDRQAEARALVAARACGAQAAEGLEDVVDLVRGHNGPRVAHDEDRLPVLGLGGHLDPAALRGGLLAVLHGPGRGWRHVVADRVLHEVEGDAFQEHAVAVDDRGGARAPDLHVPRRRLAARLVDGAVRDLGEVDGASLDELVVAAGKQEQALDELFAALVGREQGLAELLEFGWRPRIGELDLQEGAVDRERGPQLVRGVGDEALLGGEGALQALQHLVEGVGELLQLVVRTVELDPPGEVGTCHLTRRPGDPPERGQDAARHRVAEGEGDDAEPEEGEERAREQVVEGALALLVHAVVERGLEVRLGVHGAGHVRELRACVAGEAHLAAGDLEGQLLADADRLHGEQIDDREQQDARDEEHPAVEQGEPYPDGRAQPGERRLGRAERGAGGLGRDGRAAGGPGRAGSALPGGGRGHGELRSGSRSRGP
ncbi:putative two-component system sensor kinase [Streptomyces sp. Tu6071]|nr:putative two-component system sensor kinase [Streptomyces sp. Tu6071]